MQVILKTLGIINFNGAYCHVSSWVNVKFGEFLLARPNIYKPFNPAHVYFTCKTH